MFFLFSREFEVRLDLTSGPVDLCHLGFVLFTSLVTFKEKSKSYKIPNPQGKFFDD